MLNAFMYNYNDSFTTEVFAYLVEDYYSTQPLKYIQKEEEGFILI